MTPTPVPPATIRHELGRTVTLLAWVATAALAVANWPGNPSVAGIAVGVCGLLWATCWRPAVLVADDAVTVRNPTRDVRIGWAALEEASFGWALRLRAGSITCTAAAAPGPASMSVLYDRHRTPGGVLERDAIASAGQQPAPALAVVRQRWSAQGWAPAASDTSRSSPAAVSAPTSVTVTRPWLSIGVLTASATLIIAAAAWSFID